MPGPQRHPLERTYDDIQRSVTRVERYLDMFRPLLNEVEVIKFEKAVTNLKQVLEFIPKKHRKTYKDWAKEQETEEN